MAALSVEAFCVSRADVVLALVTAIAVDSEEAEAFTDAWTTEISFVNVEMLLIADNVLVTIAKLLL
jgi:hypothetical protein